MFRLFLTKSWNVYSTNWMLQSMNIIWVTLRALNRVRRSFKIKCTRLSKKGVRMVRTLPDSNTSLLRLGLDGDSYKHFASTIALDSVREGALPSSVEFQRVLLIQCSPLVWFQTVYLPKPKVKVHLLRQLFYYFLTCLHLSCSLVLVPPFLPLLQLGLEWSFKSRI